MQSGRRESPREGRARGRWTDMQKKRETDNSQDCWGGIWWTDVCVCELMEESSSLRGPELTFAHKESSLWRAAQTDTEPEAFLHSALLQPRLNKQCVCLPNLWGGSSVKATLYISPNITKHPLYLRTLSQTNQTPTFIFLVPKKSHWRVRCVFSGC